MSQKKEFDRWIKKIEETHIKKIDLGLERLHKVAKKANLCDLSCPVIMVAGTNGKGSTVATLAKLLHQAGLKVGTYTSPHLLQFNERIQVNTRALSDEALCKVFEKIEAYREETPLTFFEFTTLTALSIFKDPQYALDVVILEVGLGGRLDAVNLISPNLAIITTIGLDHQEWLGESLEEIAKEKAGIFRSKIPVILGENAKISTIMKETELFHNRTYLEGKDFSFDPFSYQWHFQGESIALRNIFLPLSSVSLALAAYTILRKEFFLLPSLREVTICLENTVMAGRAHFMKIKDKNVIVDVAHNADGAVWLAHQLEKIKQNGKIYAVWASLSDKKLTDITAPFKALIDVWFIGKLDVERASTIQDLNDALCSHQVKKTIVSSTILAAFEKALDSSKDNDTIVVFGSFYTVALILQKFFSKNVLLENNGLFIESTI